LFGSNTKELLIREIAAMMDFGLYPSAVIVLNT